MENSYFRSPWNPNHTCFPNHQNPTPKRRFVSIPVRFVESAAESNRKHSAAVIIQKLFRGFLVRKKVGVVRRIEREVEEVERRIERDLDLLLREEKERIRINEMLMALLLRLDSVRGVRDYRRKVIRKAISMQETVDTLSSPSSVKSEEAGGEDAEAEYRNSLGIEEDAPIEVQETLETIGTLANQESEVHETIGTTDQEIAEETLENQEIPEETPGNSDKTGSEVPGIMNQETSEEEPMTSEERTWEDQEIPEETPGNSDKTGSEVPGIKNQETSEEEPMTSEETGEEIPVREIGVVDEEVFPMMEEDGWSIVEAPEYDAKPEKAEESVPKQLSKPEKEKSEELGLKGMMESMLAENENLKGMLVELCERSTMQCKLMGGLAKRVEQLEKTVQAMERRKKKKSETDGALASEN